MSVIKGTRSLTRRSSLLALAAGAALALTASCSAATTDAGTANAGAKGPLVRIAVGVDPSYAPIYLAAQRGMFAKAGLNVQLMQTEGGPAAGQAVIAGTAQIGANADSTALTLMASNASLRALGVFQSSDSLLKVVLRKGVDGPKQIKTMGTFPGLGLYSTYSYLEHNGVDPKTVKIVKGAPPDLPGLLGRGSIDGYILFPPWVSKGVQSGGHVAGQIGDFGVGFTQWLVADQKWLAGHEDTAGKIFKVVAEADQIVTKDPKAAAQATQQQVKVPVDLSTKVLPEVDFAGRDFTDADVAAAKKELDFFLSQKLIKTRPDLTTVLLRGWSGRYAR